MTLVILPYVDHVEHNYYTIIVISIFIKKNTDFMNIVFSSFCVLCAILILRFYVYYYFKNSIVILTDDYKTKLNWKKSVNYG
jgi:hypothetical protein